jgi:hypothetical protein
VSNNIAIVTLLHFEIICAIEIDMYATLSTSMRNACSW